MSSSDKSTRPDWSETWPDTLRELIRDAGYESIRSLFEAMPCVPYATVTEKIDDSVAPIQIICAAYSEGRASGTTRWFARDALCRNIVEKCNHGWRVGDKSDWKVIKAISTWSNEVLTTGENPELKDTVHRIGFALRDRSIPAGWIPSSMDDPVIADLFDTHWPMNIET